MRSVKQVVAEWVYGMCLDAEKTRLRHNASVRNYVHTDTFRKDIISARYAAASKMLRITEKLDKPVNTLIALMLENPRRFTYKAERVVSKELVLSPNQYTHMDIWEYTVTDRVTKVVLSYSHTYKRGRTHHSDDVTPVTGCTKDESLYVRKAIRKLASARDVRNRKVQAYLERRNIRVERAGLLEAYPDGE